MNRLFITAFFALAALMGLMAHDKGNLVGAVVEKSSGRPMEFATVSLFQSADTNIQDGCLTDSLGRFLFFSVPAGEYYVEAATIGSLPVRSEVFTIYADSIFDVGLLRLSDRQILSEVVVEGRKPQFVAKLDRKIYNVGQDLMGSAGSASDLMQNIPSVDVDMDGIVSLRGNSDVTVLINGKPSAMMGEKTRGDVLNQMSAANIERIEVITNPSAEYKPDGVSGIINIVLKKEATLGFNGSVTANVGSYNRQNIGVNAGYAFGKINLFGGYAYRRDRYDRSIVDRRISPSDIISQDTYGLGRPISHTIRLGMNASLSDSDMLEVSGSFGCRNFHRDESIVSETADSEGETIRSYKRTRNAFAREDMWEATLRYSHTYGPGSECGIDYVYSSESEDEINHYSTAEADVNVLNDETVWDANYVSLMKLYWNHRLSDHLKLMSGYELEYLKAEQSFHVSDWNGEDFVPDRNRSSDFAHAMLLNSIYGTLECEFGKWNLLAGIRAEYAEIRNRLLSDSIVLRQHYLNFFPTLHISHPVGSADEVMLSYSMRINRPEGKDMNPFAERINPLSLEAGNPYLRPEKIHSLEAGYMWRSQAGISLLGTLYYRHITDRITEVSRYVDSGVLLTTKENLQSSRNAGAELICDFQPLRWFGFNLSLNGYYNEIDASKLGFGKRKSTFSWSSLLNADFRPFPHYMVQMNLRYCSATLVPQGRRDSDMRINLGMKYDIPAINLSLTASVTDLFDTYRKSFTLDTPELKQTVKKRRNPRIFYIGAVWQFGFDRKKDNVSLEYDEGL